MPLSDEEKELQRLASWISVPGGPMSQQNPMLAAWDRLHGHMGSINSPGGGGDILGKSRIQQNQATGAVESAFIAKYGMSPRDIMEGYRLNKTEPNPEFTGAEAKLSNTYSGLRSRFDADENAKKSLYNKQEAYYNYLLNKGKSKGAAPSDEPSIESLLSAYNTLQDPRIAQKIYERLRISGESNLPMGPEKKDSWINKYVMPALPIAGSGYYFGKEIYEKFLGNKSPKSPAPAEGKPAKEITPEEKKKYRDMLFGIEK